METFSALLIICAGKSPVTGEFPSERLVTRSFDVFFDLRLNKRLSKHSWRWWFETPSRSLWRHCNGPGLSFGQRTWLLRSSAQNLILSYLTVSFLSAELLPVGTNLSDISIKIQAFLSRKYIGKCRLRSCGHLVSASLWTLLVLESEM